MTHSVLPRDSVKTGAEDKSESEALKFGALLQYSPEAGPYSNIAQKQEYIITFSNGPETEPFLESER